MNSSINQVKNLFLPLIFLFSVFLVSGAANIVDVVISENAYEYVTYNPNVAGAGLYFNANENESAYVLNGTITIRNPHSTETVQSVVLNISSANLYNLAFSSGSTGYVTLVDTVNNYSIITIPDLGNGATSTFTYLINTTRVAPPLNFTASYADTKVFAGLPLQITDNIQNNLNVASYPINCIYGINITQNAMTATVNGTGYNFTFDSTSEAGTDATNVTFDAQNRTLYWNVQAGSCLNSTNRTDINYNIVSPANIPVAGDYGIINATLKYSINASISRAQISTINAILDVDGEFQKYMNNTLTGDNASWRISAAIQNPTNVTINLTQVTMWVSVRNGTGTGFTNPSLIDNDTISGNQLLRTLTPNFLLNSSTSNWNNTGSEWYFNSTFSSSPIVWMNHQNFIVNDGVQLTNRSVSYGNNSIYVKELYVATGYWLQVTKNITRVAEGNYTILVTVLNRGSSPTPTGQVVMVYNFIPNTFNLSSQMVFSSSTWYNTTSANQTLNDTNYNGTMYQFGLLPLTNPYTSSLAAYGSGSNTNNTWTVTYNVSGTGQFQFDDLFLSGVDPLNVQEYGATKSLTLESVYGMISSKVEYVLVGVAAVASVLLFIL